MVLSSTAAPWVALVSMVLSQAILFTSGGFAWRGEYFWSAVWVESSALPALIITAAAVAVDTTLSRSSRRQVVAEEVRWWGVSPYFVAVALFFSLPALAAFGVGTFWWRELWGSQQGWALLHLLTSLASMVAVLVVCGLVSMSTSKAAIVAAPLVATWLGLTAMGDGGLLLLGSSSGSLLGYAPSGSSLAIQAACAVVLVGGGLWTMVVWPRSGPPTGRRVLGVLALVAILALSPGMALRPYAPSLTQDSDCYGDGGRGSRVCASQQHARLLDPLDEAFADFRATADEFGMRNAPRTVVEAYTPFFSSAVQSNLRISRDVVGWTASNDELSPIRPVVTVESLLSAVVAPSHCPQLRAADPPGPLYETLSEEAYAAGLLMLDDAISGSERQQAADGLDARLAALRTCNF